MVFCTEFLDGWWSWEQLRRSYVRCGWCRATRRTAPSAPYTRPTQLLSRPPSIQKLGAKNHMLQLNIHCSWWRAYIPETCRDINTLIKPPSCIKLKFQVISWGRCKVKQPSSIIFSPVTCCYMLGSLKENVRMEDAAAIVVTPWQLTCSSCPQTCNLALFAH
jgi:hypothetical protein